MTTRDRKDTHLDVSTTRGERRHGRAGWWIAAAAAAGLLVATPALAHGGGVQRGAQSGGTQSGYGIHAPGTHMGYGNQAGYGTHMGYGTHAPGTHMYGGPSWGAGPNAMLPGMLQRLPLGTTVTVSLYDADPAEGAAATATLSATVGETSEAAFAEDLQQAAADAAYLSVEVGERTERIDLTINGVRSPLGFMGRSGGPLEFGQTVTVAFYAAEDDATPTATLSFTLGEDSEAAFRQALDDAAADAVAAEVTLPAHVRTIDLSARPFAGARGGAGYGGFGGMHAPGTFGPGMHMPGYGQPGMRGPGR